MSLNIEKSVNTNNITLTVDGRIDAGTVSTFRDEVMASVEETAGDIILECEKLEYVSSIGLRVFLTAQKELQKKNRHLEMHGVQEPIIRILRMTGFDTFIKVVL